MRVEYHPAMERELSEIIEYYDKCSQGLGEEFLDEFERQILRIATIPTRWKPLEGDTTIVNEAFSLCYLFSSYRRSYSSGDSSQTHA